MGCSRDSRRPNPTETKGTGNNGLFTADQIVCHLIGDYVLQSDSMANNKTKHLFLAFLHALIYSLPFLFFAPTLPAWVVLVATHAVIDRWRLARFVCWGKNWLFGDVPPWNECAKTGFDPEKPAWLAVWLLIIVDNVLHITINALALRYL